MGQYPFFERGVVNWKLFQTFHFSPYFLVGNVVMFIPFGFFAALLWRGCTWGRSLLAGLLLSGLIESCQLCVGRAFDIDDIFLNVLGVLCGYGLWRLARRRIPGQMEEFHVRFSEEQP